MVALKLEYDKSGHEAILNIDEVSTLLRHTRLCNQAEQQPWERFMIGYYASYGGIISVLFASLVYFYRLSSC